MPPRPPPAAAANAESTDFTHVNILAELFMDAGLFEKTYMLIDRAESVLEGEDVGGMPMDLTVKAGAWVGAGCTQCTALARMAWMALG